MTEKAPPKSLTKEGNWEIIPMGHVTLFNRQVLKAVSSMGGLVKGRAYTCYGVSDKGQLLIEKMPDRLYPMHAFVRARGPEAHAVILKNIKDGTQEYWGEPHDA